MYAKEKGLGGLNPRGEREGERVFLLPRVLLSQQETPLSYREWRRGRLTLRRGGEKKKGIPISTHGPR